MLAGIIGKISQISVTGVAVVEPPLWPNAPKTFRYIDEYGFTLKSRQDIIAENMPRQEQQMILHDLATVEAFMAIVARREPYAATMAEFFLERLKYRRTYQAQTMN